MHCTWDYFGEVEILVSTFFFFQFHIKSQKLGVWETVNCGHKNVNDSRLMPVTHDYRVEDCPWKVSTVTVRVGH